MTAVTPLTGLDLPEPGRWDRIAEGALDRIPLLEKEMLLLRRLVRPGWTCLDIGAAGGTYLHLLSRLVGAAGRVIGIEPRRRSASMLRRLHRWLAWDNVSIYRVALADVAGTARLRVPRWVRTEAHLLPSRASMGGDRGQIELVPQWTLDELVRRARLQRVDLIKCDVEGAEELVFAGAGATIRRWMPTVVCEIEPRHVGRYGRDPDRLLTALRSHGYRSYRYAGGRLRPVSTVDHRDNDYVFLPPRPGDPGVIPGG